MVVARRFRLHGCSVAHQTSRLGSQGSRRTERNRAFDETRYPGSILLILWALASDGVRIKWFIPSRVAVV